MVAMKRRSIRVALALLLLVLAGSFFLAAQPETKSASPLESLLNGSSTDLPGVLSSLNDEDLPLGLAVTEALKFKALHGDSRLSPEQVEEFHSALSQRLEKSTNVSITKTDFGPRGEAGTLLPDLWVSFVTTKNPVKAKLLLDGKPVPTVISEGKTILYRPSADAAGVLAIGTHTASIALVDASGKQASASWIFTVGVVPVAAPPIPEGAVMVGSFTLSFQDLMKGG